MPLTGQPLANYEDTRFTFIESVEGSVPTTYLDSLNIPTIGVGVALVIRDSSGSYVVRSDLETLFSNAGIGYTAADLDKLDQIATALNNGDDATIDELMNNTGPNAGEPPFTWDENGGLTETQIRSLFDQVVVDAENWVAYRLGDEAYAALAGSQEMVALVSMAYNAPSLIGATLVSQIQAGNRAGAWFEIRYRSDAHGTHTNRRNSESDMFGLYEGTPDADDYYDALRELLPLYNQGLVKSWQDDDFWLQVQPARESMASLYTNGELPDHVGSWPIDASGVKLAIPIEGELNPQRNLHLGTGYLIGREDANSLTLNVTDPTDGTSPGARTGTVEGRGGDDSLRITFRSSNLAEIDFTGRVEGGSGVDQLRLIFESGFNGLSANSTITLDGGDGTDYVTLRSFAPFRLDGALVALGGAGDVYDNLNANELHLTPDSTGTVLLDGGGGDDTLHARLYEGPAYQVIGGDGNDWIYASVNGPNDSNIVANVNNAIVDGGEGNDHIFALGYHSYGGATPWVVSGGNGDDTMEFRHSPNSVGAGTFNVTLDGGNGYDAYVVYHQTNGLGRANISIRDSDGLGEVTGYGLVSGNLVSLGDRKRDYVDGLGWPYQADNGRRVYLDMVDGNLVATYVGGEINEVITIETWQNGMLGINIVDGPLADGGGGGGGGGPKNLSTLDLLLGEPGMTSAQADVAVLAERLAQYASGFGSDIDGGFDSSLQNKPFENAALDSITSNPAAPFEKNVMIS